MYARVALESPLPQLDRLFDYEVPSGISVEPGVRVRVPFGRGIQTGFVVSLTDATDWTGKVAKLTEVISPARVLTNATYELVRAVADRQASTFGDVISNAVPNRSVRVEQAWLIDSETPNTQAVRAVSAPALPKLAARLVEPRSGIWAQELLGLAARHLSLGESAIICVPDFRDIAVLSSKAEELGLGEYLNVYSSKDVKSKQYAAFLRALNDKPQIVLGSRNSLYAPVRAGGIYLWDDADQSHTDQSAPYATSREIALIRQSQSGCNLAFLSHSRSTDVQRLIEIGYLTEATDSFAKPQIAVTDGEFRVESAAWLAIREALKTGNALVQVASTGTSRSLYCKQCAVRATCKNCNGPIWVDVQGAQKCRWCNAFALDAKCRECGSNDFRHGKAGATRTAAEIGRAFPGAQVVEVRADESVSRLPAKNCIVISTPGIEPLTADGYCAVVILDATDALTRDSLRAEEDAVRKWANAFALMRPSGRGVISGISGELANSLALWQLISKSSADLKERMALKFPPAMRMLSATGSAANVQVCKEALNATGKAEVLGISPAEAGEVRLLARFTFASGAEIANLIRELQLKLGAGNSRTNSKSGRAQRPVTFKLDDPQVL